LLQTMPLSYETVTPSRYQPRTPAGRHDLVFKVAFGSNAKAARYFRVTSMTVWRWRHDRAPLPMRVAEILTGLLQDKVAQAHLAQNELKYFLQEAPKPPRPLSGCCAGRERRLKKFRF
jgi:hypothetical protein